MPNLRPSRVPISGARPLACDAAGLQRALRAVRLGALASLALGALAACHDATPAEPTPLPSPTLSLAPTVTIVDLPAADTLARRGLEIGAVVATHGATNVVRALDMVIDSGTAAQQIVPTLEYLDTRAPSYAYSLYARPLAPGRHTFTVRATDDSGRVGAARFTRVFRVPDAAYTLVELPGPDGGDARALGMSATGVVVGQSADAVGRRRALRWPRPGPAEVLAGLDTGDASATRVDAAGDAIGVAGSCARIWRADGTVIATVAPPTGYCFRSAGDINDRRVAVVYTDFFGGAALVDVATGAVTQLAAPTNGYSVASLNDAGQAIGLAMYNDNNFQPVGWGVDVPYPDVTPRPCDACLKWHPFYPIALSSDGVYLASTLEPDLILQPLAGGRALRLDTYVGPTATGVMSRNGALVAALTPGDSTIYTFRRADRAVTRVTVADAGWRFDGLAAVNDRGQIAAHTVYLPDGRRRAVLLTPNVPNASNALGGPP